MGIWDFDEFFITKGENQNILDVIHSFYPPKNITEKKMKNMKNIERFENVKNLRVTGIDSQKPWLGNTETDGDVTEKDAGWADGADHPACYMSLR